jgi:PAS domain S-box-containing protein
MSSAYADPENNTDRSVAPSTSTRNVLWLTASAIALLAAIALVALWIVSREMAAARQSHTEVQRTREVLETLQLVLSTVQDAETGERGFVITGNETFLEPFDEAERSLQTQLTRLDSLVLDERVAKEHARLATLAREQLAFFQEVVAVRRATAGHEQAASVVGTEVGKQRMDTIRELVQRLRAHEQLQLSNRLAAFKERSERIEAIVRTAILAATLLLCSAGILLVRHIKRRLVAEQAAARTFDLMRASMDNLSQGVAVFDAKRRLVAWNSRYLELRGLSPERVRSMMPAQEIADNSALLTVSLPAGELNSRSMAMQESQSFGSLDGEAIKPDGSVLQLRGRPMPHRQYIMTYTDVTDLKQSELAYRDQATRLSLILDNVVDAIITINESGSIESWSNGAERLFGYKSEEVLRRNVKILMPDPHSSAHDGYIRRYIQTGERRIMGMRREVEALHKDGHRVAVDLGLSEMRIGKRRMFIGIVRDISARLEVERLKAGFVSTVSHELRTPLTSISGSLGLLAGGIAGELPAKATRLIDIARLNSERLVRLINDILDLEKAESGRLEFRLESQRLRPIVQHAIDLNRSYAQGFGVGIELDPRSDDANVLIDRDRLVQVLTNLLSNAAKFSPRGKSIEVRIVSHGDSVCVSVKDSGAGIPQDFQARIFQRFAQADSSDSRAKGGTGLGLSIAKTIVEQLGGSIGFESHAGQGTTFRVTLPVRHQHPPLQNSGTGLYAGPVVLICEDDPDVAMILAEILRKEGMRAETVPSARAARAALEAVKFDVAIVDLHLPDGDGLEFITELRSRDGTRALPVIVVTARSRGQSDAGTVSALQLADWLQKPIDPQRLLDAIRNVLTRPRDRRARILHVEDDVSLTELVEELLSSEADVVAAHSLAGARASLEDGEYDLVILDIVLGDGNGLDILPLLGRNGPRPPVILYSATEASREISGLVEAALVKSRDSVEELLSSVRALGKRSA